MNSALKTMPPDSTCSPGGLLLPCMASHAAREENDDALAKAIPQESRCHSHHAVLWGCGEGVSTSGMVAEWYVFGKNNVAKQLRECCELVRNAAKCKITLFNHDPIN